MFRVTFDERVPEVDVGLKNALKDSGGIGDAGGEGVAVRDELSYDDVVLFEAFADYMGVDLFEVPDACAGPKQIEDL